LAVALTADAVLKSKRLTPELRRTALAMRIESGLALGYYEQSAEDFNTWLDLNPTPDTKQLVLGTMVAFFNSQDDLALTYVGRALDLAPQDPKLAWLKLSLAYAKGDYQAAQATFKQHLESNPDGEEEVNQQLHSVMQYLLTRRNGGDVTALLAKQEQRTDLEAKDRKVIEFMKGALSWQQLEKELKEGKSRIRGNLAALHFLQAEKAWLDGNVQVAREHWTEVLRLGKPERLESIMAKRHLAQLDKSS
jgi:tetratricopeptide (TPR) repeat protein